MQKDVNEMGDTLILATGSQKGAETRLQQLRGRKNRPPSNYCFMSTGWTADTCTQY